MYGKGRELELGNATTAILISLLKTLVDKSVLSNTDVRVLLNKAASDLGPHEYAAPVKGAMMGTIVNDLVPMFPEDKPATAVGHRSSFAYTMLVRGLPGYFRISNASTSIGDESRELKRCRAATKFLERLRFDLTNPLTGNAKFLTDLFQSMVRCVTDTKTHT